MARLSIPIIDYPIDDCRLYLGIEKKTAFRNPLFESIFGARSSDSTIMVAQTSTIYSISACTC